MESFDRKSIQKTFLKLYVNLSMKILYIISNTDNHGSTLSFLTLLEYVKNRNDEPYVIIPNNNSIFVNLLNSLNIPFYIVPLIFFAYPIEKKVNWLWFPNHLYHMLRNEKKARDKINAIVKEINPDLIHTNVGVIVTGHFVAKKNNIPHIWHIREYGDLDFNHHIFPSKLVFRKLLKKDFVITITEDLLKYNNLNKSIKASVVYNGVRSENDTHFISTKEKYFLCASRISPEKGVDTIIPTFAKFLKKHFDYKLIILGNGQEEYINKIKQLCIDNHCSNAVVFEGFKKNVSSYMRRSTALIVASPHEGFGRMTAEACFEGCIVIGKKSGGTKEIIEQTGGLLFNTQEELLTYMEQVANMSAEEYTKKALFAQEKAKELFSIETYTSKIYSIYESVLEQRIS